MDNIIRIKNATVRVDKETGDIGFFDIDKETFKELTKVGRHQKSQGVEWVMFSGNSFFRKD